MSEISNPETSADEICEPCVCKVEVGAFRAVAIGGTGPSHLFIRYTLMDGTVRYYRGGPKKGNRLSEDAGATEYNSSTRPSGRLSSPHEKFTGGWQHSIHMFGPIITHWGNWDGSFEKRRYEEEPAGMIEIAKGPDHCNHHAAFVTLLREIGAANITYYAATGPNSNSVVYTMLRRAGLPTNKPDVTAPGWGMDLFSG